MLEGNIWTDLDFGAVYAVILPVPSHCCSQVLSLECPEY